MSLEQRIEELVAAVKENTAALNALRASGGVAAADAGEKKTSAAASSTLYAKVEKPAPATKGPKHTKAEVHAALNELKELKGTKVAKDLIKKFGFDKLADVTEDKYDELYEAAKRLIESEDGDDDGL